MSVSAVNEFLQKQNEVLSKHHTDVTYASWMAATTGEDEWVEKTSAAQTALSLYYADQSLLEQVKQYRQLDGLAEEEKRQLGLLYAQCVQNQLPEETLKEMNDLSSELVHAFSTYRAEIDGAPINDNDIRQILVQSDDNAEREKAWYASKQIGRVVEERLIQLVKKRNAAAQSLGYENHHQMSFELNELDREFVFETFKQLKEASDDTYRAIKAEIDEELATRFGLSVEDLRPWHYADPFFQEAPPSKDIDLDPYFQDQDLEALTVQTFEDMGLEIRDMLQNSDLYPREGKNQHAFCTDIRRPDDVRVLCNNEQSHYWSTVMLHEFGHAVYSKYVDPNLPFMLRTYAHILGTEAIAMYYGRLTKDPVWFKRYLSIDSAEVDEMAPQLHKMLQKQMLIQARWMMAFTFFERELYEDPDQDLNRLWWEIVEDVQLVHPPERQDEPHWAAKIHFTLAPVYYQNYLLGELTTSQLHDYILEHVSEDIYTPAVGTYLKAHYFHPGAKYHWNEKLEKATGAKLDPQHFIRHFVPKRMEV
ncbi:M2 family metallopeptidase [Caldalkalibacillus salinus]|uniref:M2 family metallopeptidase n=1 Tax=Caldalkalibacillus salinus TaxID=2803787 RepID=UPI001922F00B|nr:M2 family metallopeptidase [Caldalkalibacillus salinus]